MRATLEQTEDMLVVDRDDTPFIGVSGRQVAAIERGVELAVLGERGPYTIVTWGSRNGYVHTDHLVSPAEFRPAIDQDDIVAAPSRPSLNPFRLIPWMQQPAKA
jgi:hypothetical protein